MAIRWKSLPLCYQRYVERPIISISISIYIAVHIDVAAALSVALHFKVVLTIMMMITIVDVAVVVWIVARLLLLVAAELGRMKGRRRLKKLLHVDVSANDGRRGWKGD